MDKNLERFILKDKYWFSLAAAMYHGGMKSCLNILHNNTLNPLPKDRRLLYSKLVQQKPFLFTLLNRGILRFDEWDKLYPRDEATDVSCLDLGTVIALLQTICLQPPEGGWIKPDSEDLGTSAFIVKLRDFRDKLSEIKKENITTNEYHLIWEELCEILHGLDFNVTEIHDLFVKLTDEKYRITKLMYARYEVAIKKAKYFYISKCVNDTRKKYTNHLSNICTVMGVVKYSKIEKVNETAFRMKKSVALLESLFEHEKNFGFSSISKLLYLNQRINNDVSENEKNLDAIIEYYNEKISDNPNDSQVNHQEKARRKSSFARTALSLRNTIGANFKRRNSTSRSAPPRIQDYNFSFDDMRALRRNPNSTGEVELGDF